MPEASPSKREAMGFESQRSRFDSEIKRKRNETIKQKVMEIQDNIQHKPSILMQGLSPGSIELEMLDDEDREEDGLMIT